MAIRVLIDCDRCGDAEAAEHVGPISLGPGQAKYLDLCADCREALLGPAAELLREYGAKPDAPVPTPSKASSYDYSERCPECKTKLSGRGAVITHMVSTHGFTDVQASHAVPPTRTEAIECPECKYLCGGGQGLSRHMAHNHPDAA